MPPVDLPYPEQPQNAIDFGPCCPQQDAALTKQDEQCLYLNVYVPLRTTENHRLPVLFWIHGGGGTFGCSSQSIPKLYNGTNIIAEEKNVIVVTINYRLGILANLFLEEFARENRDEWPTSGNYNILDIQSALRWVQRNIVKFGGDPSRVTLFGESAGGNFAVDLGASRGSSGLYHHIISQSGVALVWNGYTNRSAANQLGQQFLNESGCRTTECLRKKNVEDLLEIYSKNSNPATTIIDGHLIPYYPTIAIEKGTYLNHIGVTIGHNLPDLFPTCATTPQMDRLSAMNFIKENLNESGIPIERFNDVLNFYRVSSCSSNGSCCQLVSDLLSDFATLCNARRLLNALYEKNNRNLFWYRFDCNPTCPTERFPGVCRHTSEIAFVFGTVSNYASKVESKCTWDQKTKEFSKKVIQHWVHMAATGQPLPSWSRYTPSKAEYYHITPYEQFSTKSWMGACDISDDIEQRQIKLLFDNTA